jgi:hypothetical protein
MIPAEGDESDPAPRDSAPGAADRVASDIPRLD